MSSNAFVQQVLAARVEHGHAFLWWLGQMGFLIKLGEDLLCVDYFASDVPERLVPVPVSPEVLEHVGLFLGTHDHGDHIDRPAWQIWKATCPEARFIAPAAHLPSLIAEGMPVSRMIGMNDGGVYRCGGVVVRAIAAAHEFLDRDPAAGLYPHLQYIIEGNGVRIYHAGDTIPYEGMRTKLRAMGALDACILPINGRDGTRYRSGCIGNLTYQEAADLAGDLRVRNAIPAHWDMFANNLGDPSLFVDLMDAKFPGQTNCIVPERLQCIDIAGARDDKEDVIV